jgi:hypothetical protein
MADVDFSGHGAGNHSAHDHENFEVVTLGARFEPRF